MKFLSALFHGPTSSASSNIKSRAPKRSNCDLSGRTVFSGAYKLNKMLEGGHTNIVYEASHTKTGELFACKVIYLQQEEAKAKLHYLCSRASKNVAKVHDYHLGEERTDTYILMDLYRGGDLYTQISEKRHTPWKDKSIKEIFTQILDGVKDCHAIGVYHQALKPENILFKEHNSNEIAITDFGTATRGLSHQCTIFPHEPFAAPGTAVLRI